MESTNRFERIAQVVLYIIAALLSLWFIPWQFDVEFGREVTFGALILLAAVFWLLSSLMQNEIHYSRSPLLWAGAVLLLSFGLSAIFSKAPLVSAIFADPVGERLSTLILGLFIMMLAGSVFRTTEGVWKLAFILVAFGALAGILGVLQLFGFSPYQLPVTSNWLPFLRGIDFNVIGTINAASLFYTALFAISTGALLGGGDKAAIRKAALISASAIFLLNIILINFWASWVALLVVGIFFFGLLFRSSASRPGKAEFDWRYWAALALIILSVVMIMFRTPLLGGFTLPAEVSPSLTATLSVGISVFQEGFKSLFLGSGPATFGIDWARYKDPSINQTIFWGLRFNQGSSWLATLLPTVGLLGFLSVVAFLAVALVAFLRKILVLREGESAMPVSIFLGLVALIPAAALYPANFSLLLLLFLLAGVLLSLLGGRESAAEVRGRFFSWDITQQSIKFRTPAATFVFSIAIVFCISLLVAGIYLIVGRVRAAYAAREGLAALNRGAIDEGISHLERAASFEQSNFHHQQTLAAARQEKIRNLIQRASQGENVQQEFQLTVSLAIQNAQAAIELNPEDSALRRAQGALYELVIPFINGSERFAAASFERAADLEPLNPAIYVDWGRAVLTFADRLQFLQGQTSGQEKDRIREAREVTLQEAERILKKAVAAKQDHAPAHFLLAQTALRLGNTVLAIQSAENAKLSAPFDIGIAFQLGLLYYQQNDLSRAEAEFLRAVSLNYNYSNAHYFLGLIYDRTGRDEEAIDQFEKVLAFNPDNEEVQKILSNLRKGRKALSGISPPGEAPEKRKETPVREGR